MGAPGWTSFCSNGHIVEVCPHHCIIDNEIEECPVCGSKEVAADIEWPDLEYEHEVPAEPIKTEERFLENKCECGKTVKIKIGDVQVFDVSRLFK